MDWTGIIIAVLSFSGTLIGTLVGFKKNADITNYKIEELTKHVEQHNKVIDRTYKLEKAAEVFEEKIKTANHRIEDLENGK